MAGSSSQSSSNAVNAGAPTPPAARRASSVSRTLSKVFGSSHNSSNDTPLTPKSRRASKVGTTNVSTGNRSAGVSVAPPAMNLGSTSFGFGADPQLANNSSSAISHLSSPDSPTHSGAFTLGKEESTLFSSATITSGSRTERSSNEYEHLKPSVAETSHDEKALKKGDTFGKADSTYTVTESDIQPDFKKLTNENSFIKEDNDGDFDSVFVNAPSLAAAIIARNTEDHGSHSRSDSQHSDRKLTLSKIGRAVRSRSNSVGRPSLSARPKQPYIPENIPAIHAATYTANTLGQRPDIDELFTIGVFGSSSFAGESNIIKESISDFRDEDQFATVVPTIDGFDNLKFATIERNNSGNDASPSYQPQPEVGSLDIDGLISASEVGSPVGSIQNNAANDLKMATSFKHSAMQMSRHKSVNSNKGDDQHHEQQQQSPTKSTTGGNGGITSIFTRSRRNSVSNNNTLTSPQRVGLSLPNKSYVYSPASDDAEEGDIDSLLAWDPQPFAEITASIPKQMVDISDLVDDAEYQVASRRYSVSHSYTGAPDYLSSNGSAKDGSLKFLSPMDQSATSPVTGDGIMSAAVNRRRRQRSNTISQMQATGELDKVNQIAASSVVSPTVNGRTRRASISNASTGASEAQSSVMVNKYLSMATSKGATSFALRNGNNDDVERNSLSTYVVANSNNGVNSSADNDCTVITGK